MSYQAMPIHWLEWLLLAASVLLLSGALITNGFLPISYGLTRILILIVTLLLIARHWRQIMQHWTLNILLLLLIVWAFASTLWSLEPALTLQRSISLLSMYLLGLYIVTRLNSRQQVRFIFWLIVFVLLMSVLFALILPDYGIMTDSHAGSWQGILSHKNVLGRLLITGFAILLVTPRVWLGINRWQSIVLLMLFVMVIWMTRSASARVLLFYFIMLVPVLYLLYQHPFLLIGLTMFGMLIGIGLLLFLLINSTEFFALFGRDATMTGRTHLWDSALRMIADRPLLGYGYTVSFTPTSPIHHLLIWEEAPHAHNGWLDTALDLGLIGAGLLTLSNLQNIWRSVIGIQTTGSPYNVFALILVLAFMGGSITDTTPFFLRDMTLLFYIMVTLALGKNNL